VPKGLFGRVRGVIRKKRGGGRMKKKKKKKKDWPRRVESSNYR